jgi:hypothetical protein
LPAGKQTLNNHVAFFPFAGDFEIEYSPHNVFSSPASAAPMPEPSSLLLVGTGLVVVARRWGKRWTLR